MQDSIMNIIFEQDEKTLAKKTAETILAQARIIAEQKERVIMALPGGRSVSGVYEEFSQSTDPVWKKIHIFLVDERLVETSDPESNFRLIKGSFAAKLVVRKILPQENLHPFITDKNTDDQGSGKYQKLLEAYGGMFDIVLVSSGEDGHIGALYPHHHALSVSGRRFITLHDSPKPPQDRMTASVELIANAFIVLLFIGDGKQAAFHKFNDKTVAIIDCPAKIAGKAKNAVIYTNLLVDT